MVEMQVAEWAAVACERCMSGGRLSRRWGVNRGTFESCRVGEMR